jgi:hypothetical protein
MPMAMDESAVGAVPMLPSVCGFPGPLAEAGVRVSTLWALHCDCLHAAHFVVAVGEGHDEFAKLVDVHRLHCRFQRRCRPSGVVDGGLSITASPTATRCLQK